MSETNPGELSLNDAVPETVPVVGGLGDVAVEPVTSEALLPASSRVRKPKTAEQKQKDAAAKKLKRAAKSDKTAKASKAAKVPKAAKPAKAAKRGRGRPPGSKNKIEGKVMKPAKAKKVRVGVKPDNDKVAIVTYVSAALQKQIARAAKDCNMAVARWTRDILAGQF